VEKLLTPKQAAELLAMPKSTLYSLIEQNKIPHYRIEGRIKLSPSKIDEWLKEREICGRGNPYSVSAKPTGSVCTNCCGQNSTLPLPQLKGVK